MNYRYTYWTGSPAHIRYGLIQEDTMKKISDSELRQWRKGVGFWKFYPDYSTMSVMSAVEFRIAVNFTLSRKQCDGYRRMSRTFIQSAALAGMCFESWHSERESIRIPEWPESWKEPLRQTQRFIFISLCITIRFICRRIFFVWSGSLQQPVL